MQISKYLTLKDVERSNTAIRKGINNRLPPELYPYAKITAALFDQIYDNFNGNVYINSFYRSEALNKAIGGSKTSQHCFAQAIDVEGKNGVTNAMVLEYAKTLNFDQIINEFQDSKGEPSWVHISVRESGNRKQLLKAIKVGGKTKYVS
jgi:hypothetical protein